MSERKLAKIVTIDSILPIEGADLVQNAQIGGWNIVIKKDEFKVGEKVVYCEIDSMLPVEDSKFSFLSNRPQKLYEGKKYHKLKSIRLRGVLSQGLLVGLEQMGLDKDIEDDTDVSEILGILKYDEEFFEPDRFSGDSFGSFPSFMPKTDQDRIQNLSKKFPFFKGIYEVSMKLDGSSISIFKKDGEIGFASRKTRLKMESEGTFKQGLINSGILKFLETVDNIAIQGELLGPGIQGNKENLTDYEIHIFDIFDIEKQKYLLSKDRLLICKENNLKHVPIIGFFDIKDFESIQELVKFADGKSLNNLLREGLVFKLAEYDIHGNVHSFKAISNMWLMEYIKA